jgi:hypothetical protein
MATMRAWQHCAAVDLLDKTVFREYLKIPPDRHVRDAQLLRKIANSGAAFVPDGLQNE